MKSAVELRGLRCGVPPLGGSSDLPPKGATPHLRPVHALITQQWASRSVWLAALVLAVAVFGIRGRAAAADAAVEYKIKAGYLFNFAKLVEWPTHALPATNSPFIIGVLGGGEALTVLQSVLQGKTVHEHPVQLLAAKADRVGQGVHLLFVPRAAGKSADVMQAALGGAATLLVGETEGFAQRGGSINFIMVDGSVKFEANPDAAARAQLKLGSQLLKLARVVKDVAPAKKI